MIEAVARQNLHAIAKAYAKATGTKVSSVSRKFYGKQGFIKDFAKGRQSITLSNLQRLIDDFGARWPEGVPWPETAPILMTRPEKKIAKSTD